MYYRLKEVFLNPKFAGSIYFEREAQIEQNDSSFTWDFIVYNMSAISKSLFKVPVENRLGFSMSQKAFPYIAKRYVFKQIYQAVKGNPEIVGAVSASATVFGIVYSEQKNTQRHKETLQLARETSEATVRAQEKMARAQIESAKAQIESAKATDNLARAQFEANQLKLKEFELRQKELPLLRPRNPDEKITDLFFSSFFKEIPYLI